MRSPSATARGGGGHARRAAGRAAQVPDHSADRDERDEHEPADAEATARSERFSARSLAGGGDRALAREEAGELRAQITSSRCAAARSSRPRSARPRQALARARRSAAAPTASRSRRSPRPISSTAALLAGVVGDEAREAPQLARGRCGRRVGRREEALAAAGHVAAHAVLDGDQRLLELAARGEGLLRAERLARRLALPVDGDDQQHQGGPEQDRHRCAQQQHAGGDAIPGRSGHWRREA